MLFHQLSLGQEFRHSGATYLKLTTRTAMSEHGVEERFADSVMVNVTAVHA
jgi:hypothetical protein